MLGFRERNLRCFHLSWSWDNSDVLPFPSGDRLSAVGRDFPSLHPPAALKGNIGKPVSNTVLCLCCHPRLGYKSRSAWVFIPVLLFSSSASLFCLVPVSENTISPLLPRGLQNPRISCALEHSDAGSSGCLGISYVPPDPLSNSLTFKFIWGICLSIRTSLFHQVFFVDAVHCVDVCMPFKASVFLSVRN